MHRSLYVLAAFVFVSFSAMLSAADPGESHKVFAKGINRGMATVYLPAQEEGGGPGHCTGVLEDDDDLVTAIRGSDYRRLKREGTDVCNKCVRFTGKIVSRKAGRVGSTRSIVARIVDVCEGSGCRHWDMSLGAFKKFQGVDVRNGKPIDHGPGYVDIDYEIVPCKHVTKRKSSSSRKRISSSSRSSNSRSRSSRSSRGCSVRKHDKDKYGRRKSRKHRRDVDNCEKYNGNGKRKGGKKHKSNKKRKSGGKHKDGSKKTKA